MNRTDFLKSLAYSGLAFTLFACQDHLTTPTGPQRFRLRQTIRATGSTTNEINTFSYNSAGRPAGYARTFEGETRQATLQYNGQGQLVSREETRADGTLASRTTYDSDANGNVIAIRTSVSSIVSSETIIEYNSDRLPSKVASFLTRGAPVGTRYYTYGNGNIVSVRTETPFLPVNEATYVYDDKPNPYYGLLGFVDDPFSIVNRNNAIIASGTYEYDSNGLLIRIGSSQNSTYTTFEYEPY